MAGNRSRELSGDRGIGHDCVASRCLSQPCATAAIRLLYGYAFHCPVDELPPQGHGDEGFRLPSSTPEASEAPSGTFILSSGHPPSFFALLCGNAVRCDHDTYGALLSSSRGACERASLPRRLLSIYFPWHRLAVKRATNLA